MHADRTIPILWKIMNLICLSDLSSADIHDIWSLVSSPSKAIEGTVAWSFEGNGIRTRTTFIQAFRDLGLAFTELPNFLKTGERVNDLAGYLDSFYDLYAIRESNHARLSEFAKATKRPVINAMSSEGHPCEVLTDAYYIETMLRPLDRVRVCLWGSPTNVFQSWHELAGILGFSIFHACEAKYHESKMNVCFVDAPPNSIDIVITDAWLSGTETTSWSLTEKHLAAMGYPKLLPTPPFSIGRELSFDPLTYSGFVGYEQKELLLPVQKAIVRFVTQG
jgi:ornithine carbamoyltransferase